MAEDNGDSGKRPIMPKRIILVRHGESTGNQDETAYVHVPDWKIPLTKQGYADGRNAGRLIKEHIGDKDPIFIYTSPYMRTKQTLAGILEAFDDEQVIGVREEPRVVEQQFGNFQNVATIQGSKAERDQFGHFFYRFPEGESGLDVYNRVTSFIGTLFRDFNNKDIAHKDLNVIIVTHGLALRLFLMRWFKYSVHAFEGTYNPPNGAFVVMERRLGQDHNPDQSDQSCSTYDPSQRAWYELTPESLALVHLAPHRSPFSCRKESISRILNELPVEPGTEEDFSLDDDLS